MDISIVIPCYCAEKNIGTVVESIEDVIMTTTSSYEMILVNDGSPDHTYEEISTIAKNNKHVIAIDLAKNCGQHAALMAGFKYATGNFVVTCEDDGQTAIELLPEMINKINDGYDVVAPILKSRGKRSVVRKIGTLLACKMGEWMIPRPKGTSIPIFFIAKKFIIDELVKYNHPYPYMEGLLFRTTYNIGYIDGYQKDRIGGESGYSLKKLFALWLNGFTTFSIKPLRFSVCAGVCSALVGIICGLFVIARKLIGIDILTGWSSMVSIMLFMFGMVLMVLGLIGEYLGRIYLCINNSPQYTIRSVVGLEDRDKNE